MECMEYKGDHYLIHGEKTLRIYFTYRNNRSI